MNRESEKLLDDAITAAVKYAKVSHKLSTRDSVRAELRNDAEQAKQKLVARINALEEVATNASWAEENRRLAARESEAGIWI